jgi:hypothetical protein
VARPKGAPSVCLRKIKIIYLNLMNIFYIHSDPTIAAKELVDDHIRKMQIESAQMLCTTFWHYGFEAPYKKAHYNHPSTKWVRESIRHFDWLLTHGLVICDEFVLRYGKQHATKQVLLWIRENKDMLYGKISATPFVPPPQCMPDIYKKEDTIEAYREFYIKDKIGIKKLNYNKLNNTPEWIKKSLL